MEDFFLAKDQKWKVVTTFKDLVERIAELLRSVNDSAGSGVSIVQDLRFELYAMPRSSRCWLVSHLFGVLSVCILLT